MRSVLAMLMLLIATGTDAAEVVVTQHAGKLAVRLLAVAYPRTLPKELISGLTNRIFVRVVLLESDKLLDQRVVEIALRYDLWDEEFVLVSTMNETVVDSRNLAGLTETQALLGALRLPDLFDIRRLVEKREYRLRVELLLNPIDQEKMRTIRRWVAQNTAPAIEGGQGGATPNTVFNRIFEQYADSDLAAAWRVTLASPAFRVESLKHEGN
jgi:hypothetical protein